MRTRVGFKRHPQRPGEGLEDGLRLVMRVASTEVVDVQRRLRMIDKSLEELADKVNVEFPDQRASERHFEYQTRSSGKIDYHPR